MQPIRMDAQQIFYTLQKFNKKITNNLIFIKSCWLSGQWKQISVIISINHSGEGSQ